MRSAHLPLKIAFVFSISLAVSSSSPSFLSFSPIKSAQTPSSPKTAASDLLSLLGTGEQAARINRHEAESFRSCFRFLVPFSPVKSEKISLRGLDPANARRRLTDAEEDALVWWPPEPVMELARLAVDSGGDPDAIYWALDPTMRTPFLSLVEPNWQMIIDLNFACLIGLSLCCNVKGATYIWKLGKAILCVLYFTCCWNPHDQLPRLDNIMKFVCGISVTPGLLHHNRYLMLMDARRIDVLSLELHMGGASSIRFHAKEYPAYNKEVFPINMGYCQTGSSVKYDDSMNLRNILWLAPLPSNVTKAWLAPGVLVVLDANPEGIVYKTLVSEYVEFVRTIYEDDFGDAVADVNYLNVRNAAPGDKIFIC